MIRERFEKPKVRLGEQPSLATTVEVDGADDPGSRTQRHAEQRPDAVQPDTGEGVEARIVSCIDGENRLASAGLSHDSMADGLEVCHRLFLEITSDPHRELIA